MRISDWSSDVCSSDLLLVENSDGGYAVDVEVLKQLVGDATVSTADEKSGLSWHGKRQARPLALTPSTGTLLPRPNESIEWAGPRNLLIVVDNTEVLNILQKNNNHNIKANSINQP